MSGSFKVEVEEAVRKLQKLGKDLGKEKTADQTIKKALSFVGLKAQNNINNKSGTLSESIGVYKDKAAQEKKGRSFGAFVGPRIFGKWKGYHGHLVEFGTKERIFAKPRIIRLRRGGNFIFVKVKGTGRTRPQKYMIKGWTAGKSFALKSLNSDIKKNIKKSLKSKA